MSTIAGAISGVLAPVIEGIISRRPAAGAAPAVDPQAEITALLESGGDAWTFDDAGNAVGVRGVQTLTATGDGGVTPGLVDDCATIGSALGTPCYETTGANIVASVFTGGNYWISLRSKTTNTFFSSLQRNVALTLIGTGGASIVSIDTRQSGATARAAQVTVYDTTGGAATLTSSLATLANWSSIDVTLNATTRVASLYVDGALADSDTVSGAADFDFDALGVPDSMTVCTAIAGTGSLTAFIDEMLIAAGIPALESIQWLHNAGAGRSMTLFAADS